MASITVQAESYACDHPKCKKIHTVGKGELPPGISMTVYVGDAQDEQEVYACGRMHVGRAILGVYDETTTRLNGGVPVQDNTSSSLDDED